MAFYPHSNRFTRYIIDNQKDWKFRPYLHFIRHRKASALENDGEREKCTRAKNINQTSSFLMLSPENTTQLGCCYSHNIITNLMRNVSKRQHHSVLWSVHGNFLLYLSLAPQSNSFVNFTFSILMSFSISKFTFFLKINWINFKSIYSFHSSCLCKMYSKIASFSFLIPIIPSSCYFWEIQFNFTQKIKYIHEI
jgi:hypothetical protein